MRINQPIVYQRLEGGVILVACILMSDNIVTYGGVAWWWLALGLLVPDLSIIAYAAGAKIGATVYNLAHTYAFPVLALLAAMIANVNWLWIAGIVWAAHVALDRLMGLGLKLPEGFRHTHLGDIGKDAK